MKPGQNIIEKTGNTIAYGVLLKSYKKMGIIPLATLAVIVHHQDMDIQGVTTEEFIDIRGKKYGITIWTSP